MAKRRGKKLKDKAKTISGPDADIKMKKRKKKKASKVKAINAVPPAPASLLDPPQAHASSPATNGIKAASRGKEKAKNKLEQLSGFIFMCNAKTKPECFRYRVFGLPAGRRADVEKIKAGMKLFLFDVDLKLLYGVYKATCPGQMNLETYAFGGKFPAQVSFAIYKDCLPLHESAFRRAIKDNYQGSKFNPELSGRQVKDILSLFRPCAAPMAPMPEVAPLQPIRPSALENQFQPSVRLPPQDPYLASMQHGYAAQMIEDQLHASVRPLPPQDPHLARTKYVHAASMIEPHPVQRSLLSSQHELYGTVATMDHAYPSMEHQSLPAPNDPYYFTENRQPYLGEDTAQIMQDQYPRYRAVQEMVPRDQHIGLEREYYRLPLPREREFDLQQDNVAGYNNYPMHTTTPPGPPAAGYYNTYPMPATPHGPPVAGYYNTYPTTATSHGQPLGHPYGQVLPARAELPGMTDPVSSYYSFAGAKQVYR